MAVKTTVGMAGLRAVIYELGWLDGWLDCRLLG